MVTTSATRKDSFDDVTKLYQKKDTDTVQNLSPKVNVEPLLQMILEKLTRIKNQIAEIREQQQQTAKAPRLVERVKS